jgi:hypothetical protein
MRDIRSDLQERATLIDGEIRAAYAHFEKTVQQLQSERDARISDLKSGLAMIGKFMEFEERYLGNSSPVVPGSQYGSQRRFFPRRRKRGARRAPYARKSLLRSELIRELPNGTYAPPTMSQAIKLRRVV